jgi:hypothetical protein
LIEHSLLDEALTDEERAVFGRIRPRFMGGEYLPPLESEEVEIARISLRSTTGDVNSVRAQLRRGKIRYRIVDEYADEPLQRFKCRPKVSARPLTMGELIHLIDGVEGDVFPEFGRGMTSSYRDMALGDSRPEKVVDFVSVSSAFYPELGDYYDEEALEWLESWKKKFGDDDEDILD